MECPVAWQDTGIKGWSPPAAEKIRTIEKSNSQKIAGVYMNPTGNDHMTLTYFLEVNGFSGIIHMVDSCRRCISGT